MRAMQRCAVEVGLVEQHDFAFGTSSRSSRLLHGGLRYLAKAASDWCMKRASKKRYSRDRPPPAEPLPFIFPTYRGNRTGCSGS